MGAGGEVGRPKADEALDALCQRLLALQTDTVGDVLDEMGLRHQILSAQIRPLNQEMKVAGPAFTIKGQTAAHSTVQADGSGPKPGYEMFRRMYEGCVAVMEVGGHTIGAPWGENSALSARVRGCAGIVIDGGTRDGRELMAMPFPTFSTFISAARVEGRWAHLAFEIPITMPGQTAREVLVHPRDVILADFDGVVVIPRRLAAAVVEAAEEVERIEERIRADLTAGVDREEVYRRHPRYTHIVRQAE
jgi:regulator of RNase E activity RraA